MHHCIKGHVCLPDVGDVERDRVVAVSLVGVKPIWLSIDVATNEAAPAAAPQAAAAARDAPPVQAAANTATAVITAPSIPLFPDPILLSYSVKDLIHKVS